MLANYDAEAVAAVLGIAFMQGSEIEPAPSVGAKRSTSKVVDKFTFTVDRTSVHVVYMVSERTGHEIVRRPSPFLIEKAVQNGFPRPVLWHVAERLAGGDRSKISALEWGVVPRTTLERRVERLSPQESERTERVARLFVHACRALGTDDEGRRFMTSAHAELDGRSPIDAAMTDLGARRTEQILNALEFGLAL